jgi:hypothetical protein
MVTKFTDATAPKTEIFYPETDGMPLPDSLEQGRFLREIAIVLAGFFFDDQTIEVDSDTFIYFIEGDPNRRVAPDLYIVFGISKESLERNNVYLVWEVGKFPDFVMEVGSSSTANNDLGPKRALYAELGALEYWRYDPTGGDHYGEPLVGEYLLDGEYRRFEMMPDPDGYPRVHSPLLNLDLRWEEDRLHFYDPVAGVWLENYQEVMARASAAEAQVESAEDRIAQLEAELQRLRGERSSG